MGKYSSDRSLKEYCDRIWKVSPVSVELKPYMQSEAGLVVHK